MNFRTKEFLHELVVLLVFIVWASGCQDQVFLIDVNENTEQQDDKTDDFDPKSSHVLREGDRVFIVDRTEKRWEVTHAEKVYGFKPEEFQFGLGPNAIKPVLNPEMLCAGDAGYPLADETPLVMGVDFMGYQRAYPIDVMSRYEVANEIFGAAHVAVAY